MFGSHIYEKPVRIEKKKYLLFKAFVPADFFSRQRKFDMFSKTQDNSQWAKTVFIF